MNLNGKEYFYIRNVQNDVIGLHDSEGKVVVNYSYDTWGNIVSISGSLKDSVGKKNPYRYRGYRYDEETGMYYLQSRYYNGSWGRFINSDAVIGQPGDILSFNMFAYCHNNPVNMSDDSGYWPKWLKTVAKAVKKAVNKVVKKVKNVYNAVKTKVVSRFKDTVKGLVQGAGDNVVGKAISKQLTKSTTDIRYYRFNKNTKLGIEMDTTINRSNIPKFKVSNSIVKVGGAITMAWTGIEITKDIVTGDKRQLTKDVIGFAAGVAIGVGIGLLGCTGVGAIVAGAVISAYVGEKIDKKVDNYFDKNES